MPAVESLLDRPATGVALRIVRRQLRDVAQAWKRLERRDADALHALRVALRRLRSTLRAYRAQVAGVVRKKDRRRLKAFATATGPARDAEIQIAHLDSLRADAGPQERRTIALVMRTLRRRTGDGHSVALDPHVPKVVRGLRRRIREANTSDVDASFGQVLGGLLRSHAEELRPLLAPGGTPGTASLHQARIAIKRVRYLLDPVRRSVPASDVLLKRLSRLQDILGEIHDFEVLEATLRAARATPAARVGVPALLRSVRTRQRHLFDEAIQTGIGPNAELVLAPLELLAARLCTRRHGPLQLRAATRATPPVVVSGGGK
jgi:CHAD domain-containing protein